MKRQILKLSQIKIDGGTQPRVKIDTAAVDEYAEAMQAGATFPPVVVFHDGAAYWLAEGFHRFHAEAKRCSKTVEAEVRTGTQRDAILFSVGANASHGLRRSNADKRKAVEMVLADPEWAKWSDSKIADLCVVSPHLVADVRSSLCAAHSENPKNGSGASANAVEPPRTYTTKHGTTATMNTGNIGRKPEQAEPQPEPESASEADAQTPPPVDPAWPWAEFDAAIDPVLLELQSVGRKLSDALEVKTGNVCSKWGKFISYASTVGAVKQIITAIQQNRPAAVIAKEPGFATKTQVEISKGVSRRK